MTVGELIGDLLQLPKNAIITLSIEYSAGFECVETDLSDELKVVSYPETNEVTISRVI